MLQPAAPKAGTPAVAGQTQEAHPAAPAAGQPPGVGSIFGSPIFLMLLFLPFIFMMWRRNKKETEARSKMKKGDKVIAGGLIGEVVDTDERIVKVKIAPGVTVQALASALSPLEEPKPADTSKDAKDAKAKASAKSTKDEVASKPS
jgi:preprotein translocase subunit YajC